MILGGDIAVLSSAARQLLKQRLSSCFLHICQAPMWRLSAAEVKADVVGRSSVSGNAPACL
jgi:hypothetical protein